MWSILLTPFDTWEKLQQQTNVQKEEWFDPSESKYKFEFGLDCKALYPSLLHIFPSQIFRAPHTLKIFRWQTVYANYTFPFPFLLYTFYLNTTQINTYSILRNGSVKVVLFASIFIFYSQGGGKSCKFLWTVCLLVEVINPSTHHPRTGSIPQAPMTSSLLDQFRLPTRSETIACVSVT